MLSPDEHIRLLRDALQAASDHLDYCGYGDRWECQVAVAAHLPEKIADALSKTKVGS